MMWRKNFLKGTVNRIGRYALMLDGTALNNLREKFLGADGNLGQPFPTQTGQRSGELTANCG